MNTHKEPLSNCCGAKPCGEIAYDNSGRCGDCKEGCMFIKECDSSCGINADPADGFGRCTCGNEGLVEPKEDTTEASEWVGLKFKQQQEIARLMELAEKPSSNSNKSRYALYALIDDLIVEAYEKGVKQTKEQ